jgi:WD repeat-containing protein 19
MWLCDHPLTCVFTDVVRVRAFVSVCVFEWSRFYACGSGGDTRLVREQEYIGSVKTIQLNATHAAVLCEGKIHVHPIIPTSAVDETKHFPDKDEMDITCMSLCADFLIFGTKDGSLYHYFVADGGYVNEYRPQALDASSSTDMTASSVGPWAAVFPNPTGTRCVLVDTAQMAWLYSPIDDSRLPIPRFPSTARNVLWDAADTGVFVVFDLSAQRALLTYAYLPSTMKGPQVQQVGMTKVPVSSFVPVTIFNGVAYGQTGSGDLAHAVLASHDAINLPPGTSRRTPEKARTAAQQFFALGRLREAWEIVAASRNKELLQMMARRSQELLEIDFAVRAYRELGEAASVLALEPLISVDDRNLIAGHLCLMAGQHQDAQTWFLESTNPHAALDMRRVRGASMIDSELFCVCDYLRQTCRDSVPGVMMVMMVTDDASGAYA